MFELQALILRPGGRHLLGPVSLRLPAGPRLCLLGPSGSGKTSLLKVLAGWARPAAGQVRLLDDLHPATDLTALRRRVQLVPQQPWLGAGTLREALCLGHQLQRLAAPADGILQVELAELGLEALSLDAPVAGLSGGEAMRVAVLRALLLPARAILLDEPTAALDDHAAGRLLARLERPGTPPLLGASHDPRFLVGSIPLELREGGLHA